jgi:hypothetical protein
VRGRLHFVIPTSTMRHFRTKASSSATNPTNDPPPTPTSPIVEYLKQELATFYPRTKDTRALAASSSAIALSIASPSCDPIDAALDELRSSKESGWRTAYRAAKIAVDIANASSDMFLPLKAVVGALSVLLENYDVSTPKALTPPANYRFLQQHTANVEQLREIEKRVLSISEVLTSPVDDQDNDEKARRKTLRKFVLPPLRRDASIYLSPIRHSQEVS